MTLDLADCAVSGAALPEAFLRFELTSLLTRKGLIGPTHGWDRLREGLKGLRGEAGAGRVRRNVLDPLAAALRYAPPRRGAPVATRAGAEDGGMILRAPDGGHLRVWSAAQGIDLEFGMADRARVPA